MLGVGLPSLLLLERQEERQYATSTRPIPFLPEVAFSTAERRYILFWHFCRGLSGKAIAKQMLALQQQQQQQVDSAATDEGDDDDASSKKKKKKKAPLAPAITAATTQGRLGTQINALLQMCVRRREATEQERTELMQRYNVYVGERPRAKAVDVMRDNTYFHYSGRNDALEHFRSLPQEERQHWEKERVKQQAQYFRLAKQRLWQSDPAVVGEFHEELRRLTSCSPSSFIVRGKTYTWREESILVPDHEKHRDQAYFDQVLLPRLEERIEFNAALRSLPNWAFLPEPAAAASASRKRRAPPMEFDIADNVGRRARIKRGGMRAHCGGSGGCDF